VSAGVGRPVEVARVRRKARIVQHLQNFIELQRKFRELLQVFVRQRLARFLLRREEIEKRQPVVHQFEDRRPQRRFRFVVVAVVSLGQLFEALFRVIVEHRLLRLVGELQLFAAEGAGEELLEIEFPRIAAVENITVHLDRGERRADFAQQRADLSGFAARDAEAFRQFHGFALVVGMLPGQHRVVRIEIDFNARRAADEFVERGGVLRLGQRSGPEETGIGELFRNLRISLKAVEHRLQRRLIRSDPVFDGGVFALFAGEIGEFDLAVLPVEHPAVQRVADAEMVLLEEFRQVEHIERHQVGRLRVP